MEYNFPTKPSLKVKFKDLWKKIKKSYTKGELLQDSKEYLLGNYRYILYYSPFSFLLRTHIYQQIEYRLKWMDRDCYNEGSCKICGCQTVQLQMANKSCDKPCYPRMMNRKDWKRYNSYNIVVQKNKDGDRYWKKHYKTRKPVCHIYVLGKD